MHVSLVELLALLAVVAVAALVQGAVGFGMNLLLVPVVAIVVPDAIPAATLLLTMPLTWAMAVHERDHVHGATVGWITLGRLPGTLVGAWLVASLTPDAIGALAGALVVVAVAASLVAPPVPVTPANSALAGVASGTMGTAVSIGGPPLALLLQHHTGPQIRGTLAAAFVVGGLMSAAALALGGEIHAWHLVLTAALLPGVAVGLLASVRLRRRLDGAWVRPAVLVVAAVTGAAAVARTVW